MYKKRDIVGNRYGKLTVIADLPITIYYRLKHGMSDEDAIKEIVRE